MKSKINDIFIYKLVKIRWWWVFVCCMGSSSKWSFWHCKILNRWKRCMADLRWWNWKCYLSYSEKWSSWNCKILNRKIRKDIWRLSWSFKVYWDCRIYWRRRTIQMRSFIYLQKNRSWGIKVSWVTFRLVEFRPK